MHGLESLHALLILFHEHPDFLQWRADVKVAHSSAAVASVDFTVSANGGGVGGEVKTETHFLAFHRHPATLLHFPFLVSFEQRSALGAVGTAAAAAMMHTTRTTWVAIFIV